MSGLARTGEFFLVIRQERNQRNVPSSPALRATLTPARQAGRAGNSLRSNSRPGLPRLDTPPFGGSEGKKDSSAVRPSPQPSPPGEGAKSSVKEQLHRGRHYSRTTLVSLRLFFDSRHTSTRNCSEGPRTGLGRDRRLGRLESRST